MYCKLCNRDVGVLGRHFRFSHKNLNIQSYYDKYILSEDKICPYCNKKDRLFMGLRLGYAKTCGDIECKNKAWQKTLKKTLKEKYNDEHYNNRIKNKQTCIDRYECENVFQNEKIKEKCKATLFKNYNVDNPLKSNIIKKKVHDTTLLNYDGIGYADKTIFNKCKQTLLNDTGYEYAMQNPINQQKSKNTRYEKYNSYYRLEKFIKTCQEKYGCNNPMQNHDIFKKTKRKIKYENLYFDSKPELDLYKFLKANNIDFEYQPKQIFYYEYNSKIHTYNPDFRIENCFVELKGLHFFENRDPTKRMINPYDRTQDDLYEAKHQCMIKNNIIIIAV